ncbi:MAG TPA: hypothetical protein H9891_11465 [Candidatus Salinicoccus stercoripullorum]|uniref:Uncharacterized protein n=1 Tax=Candidatus Salinicoccus stercoripullorum TaxID=2838756 RepID=A0A9D1U1E9_9STAP|nr:hypothetical protein [Candidatus Salinicoccus stercoripullorum]
MSDVIIVGSGLAVLSFIEVLDESNHGESHLSDTYETGSRIGDREVIRRMIGKNDGLIKRYMDDDPILSG